MEALRTLSTRAQIMATSFTNHYKWGDFQGDLATHRPCLPLMARSSLQPREGARRWTVELKPCRGTLRSGIPRHIGGSNQASGEARLIIVIQCAARKQDHAGRLRALDGRKVMFVAKPNAAPPGGSEVYAQPDDVSDTGKSWRTVLQEYNAAPGDNPLGPVISDRWSKFPQYEGKTHAPFLGRLPIASRTWSRKSCGANACICRASGEGTMHCTPRSSASTAASTRSRPR